MTSSKPGATTLTQDAGAWRLALSGEHDLTTVQTLDQEMERLAASGASIVIDLADATFIDSQVIAWIVRWWRRSAETPDLHLAVATGDDASPARRLIDLVELGDTLPCYPTATEAVHHLVTDADPV